MELGLPTNDDMEQQSVDLEDEVLVKKEVILKPVTGFSEAGIHVKKELNLNSIEEEQCHIAHEHVWIKCDPDSTSATTSKLETNNEDSEDIVESSTDFRSSFTNQELIDKTVDHNFTDDCSLLCDICHKTFTSYVKLKEHECEHTEERPSVSELCETTFTIHTSPRRPKVMFITGENCIICDKSFSEHTVIEKHEDTDFAERPYCCCVCRKSFTERSLLRRHQRTHTRERPYACDVCSKTYIYLPSLKSHARKHTGERPYVCNVCEKSFIDSSHLKRHERTHTGERPYPCEFCDKAFADSSDLKKHERTHTGERSFFCELCKNSFSRKAHMAKHIARQHANKKLVFNCRK